MITIRRLLLFSFLALLAGCASPCGGPADGHGTGESCHYTFEVKKIDVDNLLVQGVVPDLVFKDAETPIPKTKRIFFFRLHELELLLARNQIKIDHIYDFSGQKNSPYVELLPREIRCSACSLGVQQNACDLVTKEVCNASY